jgi:DNA-binding NtrC family response regulator
MSLQSQPNLQPEQSLGCVLVVEDEVVVRAILANELRSANFVVIEASCADDAIAFLRSNARADLVFSDVQMPGRLDGQQLAKLINRDYPDTPVILTSGNIDIAVQVKTVQFLKKPYRIAQGVKLIFSTLDLTPPPESCL